jgi:hypothetical protein
MADTTGTEDITVAMAEGSIEGSWSWNGLKFTGARLFSLALIVVVAFTVCAMWKAYNTGDITDLKEVALIVVAFFFGRKS